MPKNPQNNQALGELEQGRLHGYDSEHSLTIYTVKNTFSK
jgi:hypothetical protein